MILDHDNSPSSKVACICSQHTTPRDYLYEFSYMSFTKVMITMMIMIMIIVTTRMMMTGMKKIPLGQVDQVYSQGEPDRQLPHSGFLERSGTRAPGNDDYDDDYMMVMNMLMNMMTMTMMMTRLYIVVLAVMKILVTGINRINRIFGITGITW